MQINVKKLHPDAILPTYGTDGAACFDIYADGDGYVVHGESCPVDTGLSFEIPKGYVMLVYPRSGLAYKFDVRLANCVGVIDSDYRGELKVILAADDIDRPYYFERGDRIAQGMIIPIVQNTFQEVEELSNTDRGTRGFGSTGS